MSNQVVQMQSKEMDEMAEAGITQDPICYPDDGPDEEDCEHGDIDDFECLDCGKDMTEWLMAEAEYAYEGDR